MTLQVHRVRFVAGITVLLIGSAALACRPSPIRQATYAVTIIGDAGTSPVLRVTADGQVAATLGDGGRTFALRGRPSPIYTDMLPELRVEMLMPCGWRPLSVRVASQPSADELRQAASSGTPAPLKVEVDASSILPPTERYVQFFLVDNRGSEAKELALGQLVVPLVGGTSKVSLPKPDCEAGRVVSLNGKEIGRLSDATTHIIDTSGKRCYHYRQVLYTPRGASLPYGTDEYDLPRGRLIPFRGLHDYFLEPAPRSVELSVNAYRDVLGNAVEDRGVIADVPCR